MLASYRLPNTRDSRIGISLGGDISLLAVNSDPKKSQLCLYHSHDGGDAFGHQVPVSAPGAQVSSHGENSPISAEVARGPVVLWEQSGAGGSSAMMVARSLSWGNSFETPQRVSDDKAKPYIGYLASDGAQKLAAVWLDGRDPENAKSDTASIYGAFSSDGGATWGANFRVATGVCPCCRPQALFPAVRQNPGGVAQSFPRSNPRHGERVFFGQRPELEFGDAHRGGQLAHQRLPRNRAATSRKSATKSAPRGIPPATRAAPETSPASA